MSGPNPKKTITSNVGGIVITIDASDANLSPHQLGSLQAKMADIVAIVGGVTHTHTIRNADLEHAQHQQHSGTIEPHL